MKSRFILLFVICLWGAGTNAQTITTFAGPGISAGWSDPVTDDYQGGMCTDAAGNIYIAGAEAPCVRKITPAGAVSIIAGNASGGGYLGDGGAAASALLFNPYDVKVDNSGNIYISDASNFEYEKLIRMETSAR